MIRTVARLALIAVIAGAAALTSADADAEPRHGLSLFGPLKYGPDFPHFDYVNPDAPKGGLFHRATVGSFDSLNPFILKGDPAALTGLPFESLLESSGDEADAAYGLLAETVELSDDRSWVRFVMRPEARWHDGSPITADDVVFSFTTLMADGHPNYRIQFTGVSGVEKEDDRTVVFRFDDLENRKLPLLVGGMPVFSKAYYTANDFTKTSLEPPLGSGPYRVARVDPGRAITLSRVEDHWARDLPISVGRYNFDEIRVDYYRDRTVLVEALKSGEYDYHEEFTSKTWVTGYDIDAVQEGWLIKEVVPDNTPSGVQAFFINTRLDKFADPRVREALSYAFDYEWTNKTLFFGLYDRMASYFENSELAARDLPSDGELTLLEPFRGQIPEEVFTKPFTPPATDGSGKNRRNLRAAKKLLEEAGWVVKDGALVNAATNQAMAVEFLYFEPTFERILGPYARSLERLGVEAKLRLVDQTEYIRRLEEHDFDITTRRFVQQLSPGGELRSYFSSTTANQSGSLNSSGIKSPVVDALIERVLSASDRESMIMAARALDRVLLWGHYMVPQWYKGQHHLVFWDKFGRPATMPRYGIGELDTWWVDPAKDGKLATYRKKSS